MLRRIARMTVKPIVKALGYEIRIADRSTPDSRYGPIRTSATYTPWNVDREFSRVFDIVQESTLSRYGPIRTSATYTPWNVDREFSRVFDIVQESTLVDRYRCFELWSLVAQVRHLEGGLLEVGVWNGGTGALIA